VNCQGLHLPLAYERGCGAFQDHYWKRQPVVSNLTSANERESGSKVTLKVPTVFFRRVCNDIFSKTASEWMRSARP